MKLRLVALSASSIILAAWPATMALGADGDTGDNDYRPPSYCTASASPAKVKAGGSTTVTVKTTPDSKTTLTITSKSSSATKTATAGADGNASFPLTLKETGDYSLSALGENGEACALSVVAEKPTKTVSEKKTESTSESTELALTGSSTTPYLITAAALMATGISAVVLVWRRRES